MKLLNLLKPQQVVYYTDLQSKKQVLEKVSDLFCEQSPWLNQKEVFNCLLERERVSSTALGHGVAIPHCRSNIIKKPLACLISLDHSIDFDSLDKEPVNLIFGLIVPEENHKQHLALLSEVAKLLSNENIRNSLSTAHSSNDLYQKLNTN